MKTALRRLSLLTVPLLLFVSVLSVHLARPSAAQAATASVTCADGSDAPGGDTANCSDCPKPSFFGLKPWYYYLPLKRPPQNLPGGPVTGKCVVDLALTDSSQNTNEGNINKLWLIGIVLFEDLLRIASLVAVVFVIYGGVRYITSQGEPDQTKAAQGTIIDALIGLVIAIVGATVVAFIGNHLGGGP